MIKDEEISTLINGFIHTGLKIGLQSACGNCYQICLFRYDDGWSLELVESDDDRIKRALMKIDYPKNLPDDNLDAAIELASKLSVTIHGWSLRSRMGKTGGKKSSANLTPEQRRERAKKAVAARIAKYGQKSRKND